MATPSEIRSPTNLIIDRLTDLSNQVIGAAHGTERTGKITLTNGAAAVTGTDTLFVAQVAIGNYIAIKSDRLGYAGFGLVSNVANDTTITIDANYTGPTESGNYVVLTKDEYLEAVEYPSLVDVRIYDTMKEFAPNTPYIEWWFYSEEITDHGENALGFVACTVAVHRSNFRLMQQESNEIIHDLLRWIHMHHSQTHWDYIEYAGFESPTVYTDEDQRKETLVTTYFFNIAFTRQAY